MTQQILSRHGNGDWGVKRRLIAALATPGTNRDNPTATTLLFIVPGHSSPVGARGFGREYNQTALVLYRPSIYGGGRYDTIWLDKGRITRETLHKHAYQIDTAFGVEIAHTLKPHETVWVEEFGIPKGVYWSSEGSNFYSASGRKGKGIPFYEHWKDRKDQFPQAAPLDGLQKALKALLDE